MGHLWDLIQEHLDEYGVRDAAFARRLRTTPQTLNSLKKRGIKQLPARGFLEAIARETRTSYGVVLDAALLDAGYLDDAFLPVGHKDPAIDAAYKIIGRRDEDMLWRLIDSGRPAAGGRAVTTEDASAAREQLQREDSRDPSRAGD